MDEQIQLHGFCDLKVVQLSFQLALEIFEKARNFPRDEKYSLTDQIIRSARSICANLAEAWCQRKHPRSFVAMLVDSAAEAAETKVWIDFSFSHGYMEKVQHDYFFNKYVEAAKMLNGMIRHPEKFCH